MSSEKLFYQFGQDYATLSLTPNKKIYDERVIRRSGLEFRVWDSMKSKLGAALAKGLREMPIRKGMKLLYLGISTGTTASHISDMIGKEGTIYGVEFSPRSMRDLVEISRIRPNIVPILGDARLPEDYAQQIEQVELVYADVAQPDQTEILIRNAEAFLKPSGFIMIAIKARSIDVSEKPTVIFEREKKKLEQKFTILQEVRLDPLEKDHTFFVGRLK